MKWTVGLDLRPRSEGPVVFAKWLAGAASGDELHGVHVLEQESAQFALGLQAMGDLQGLENLFDPNALREQANDAVESLIKRTGAAAAFASTEITLDSSAQARLTAAVDATPGSGLIIGRRAKRGEDRIVRLGRVARKLLRRLPGPTIVTPPDLEPRLIGAGPIVVATDLADDAIAAVHFASTLAQRVGRELLLVHVVPMPEDWVHQFVPSEKIEAVRQELQRNGERRLASWIKHSDIKAPHTPLVVQGEVVHQLVELGALQDAPLLVCGSRKLGPFARIFVASIASELTAAAGRAVAVVPPDYVPSVG
ncbi:MAG: universal stress protein [Myxococcales bacterium]|nr:universal stress protein [Myxococcales bacterium]MCB9753187.1 universal stress protein [Myxococcales bacterium]